MQFNSSLIASGLALGALLCAPALISAQAPSLGSAHDFAVLGGSTVTNAGETIVTGDLGVSPGTSVAGFPPGILIGTLHAGDAVALAAQNDLTTAYDALAGAACTSVLTGQDLGGLTLAPGVYCFAASAPLNGALVLDGLGDPDAVFIFQIGSTLLAAIDSSVQVINGAREDNVFWQVGSSATLASGAVFKGNIVALASITLSVGSNVSGRALARTGGVTMDTGSVSTPVDDSCSTLASVTQLSSGCGVPAPVLTCTTPVMGQQAMVVLDGTVGFAPVVLRASPLRGPRASLDDCHLYLNPETFVVASFMTNASGHFAGMRAIPSDPMFCGTRWVLQAVVLAPSGPRAFSTSNALVLTFGN